MTTSAEFPLVFIPAAGLGSRVRQYGISKPLVSLGQLPAICRLILNYPKGTEFLVALGHKGEYLQQVLGAFSKLYKISINYVWTDSHLQPASESKGLTRTVLDARPFLQRSFVFHSVDTLLQGDEWLHLISRPIDTVLVAPTQHEGVYRIPREIKLAKANCVQGDLAYVGVSRIQNYRQFWVEFDKHLPSSPPEEGESLGIILDQFNVESLAPGSWSDLGSPQQLEAALSKFQNPDNILNKADEAIWVFGDQMVKFHESQKFISERLARSTALRGFVPNCTSPSSNLLVYERHPGQVLSSCRLESCFEDFLSLCLRFWNEIEIDEAVDSFDFLTFYKSKTFDRLSAYLEKYPEDSEISSVNDIFGSTVWSQIGSIDWNELAAPALARVHGDLHTENVVHDHDTKNFIFVDWRQSIAGSLGPLGDINYDLAKILHGLIVDHATIGKGKFSVQDTDFKTTRIKIEIPENKAVWLGKFSNFMVDNNIDSSRVWLLTGLIFINIAPLHHEGYDRFLFRLGLLILYSYGDPNARSSIKESLRFA